MADWVNLIGMALGAVATVAGTAWRVRSLLSQTETAILDKMNSHEIEDQKRFAAVDRTISAASAKTLHDAGEMGSALRQHMHEAEMWGRDNYLRKETFNLVVGRMEKVTDRLEENLRQSSAS